MNYKIKNVKEDSLRRCVTLDADNCLSLASILDAFNGPINEEQAWALCYQTAKCVQNVHCKYQLYSISDAKYMFIHKDGSVHEKTITFTDGSRVLASSLSAILSTLGVTLFQALDYGISEEEERTLDPNLEILIEKLASSDSLTNAGECEEYRSSDDEKDSKDEGIERDSPDDESEHHLNLIEMTTEKVIEMCVSHLSCPEQADSHYKAVCRALVAETLELSTFLEKITKGTKELRKSSVFVVNEKLHENSTNLDDLGVADWARLWMQVIRELRRGVGLKKVNLSAEHRMEYELTPYEMLLDDIRLRRYKLNKVMVNGDIPQRVKKDAHALILEFIRSRPPLVPASKRQLRPPPPKQQTLYEKLMQSIRQQHKLKPTPPSSAKQSPIHLGRVMKVEFSRTKLEESDSTPQPQRRLIKPDLTLRLSNSYDDEDDTRFELPSADELSTENVFENGAEEKLEENVMKSEEICVPEEPQPQSQPQPKSATLKKRFSFKNFAKALSFEKHERRHSISVCESPSSKVSTSADTRQEHNNNEESDELVLDPNEDTRERVASIWAATAWGKTYDCLSLTLDEVQHIRSVLTKAELESLGVTKSLRDDLEKGRICFTCLKTRFSFFGPWPVKCKLCERLICEKCCTKMHVPTEHYAEIPIYMLSPTPTPSPPGDDEPSFFPNFPQNLLNSEQQIAKSEQKTKKSKFMRALTMKRTEFKDEESLKDSDEHLRDAKAAEKRKGGPLMKLCRDCKLLVRHIIDVGYANYDSSFRKSWPRKGKSVSRFTSQRFQTEENRDNNETLKTSNS